MAAGESSGMRFKPDVAGGREATRRSDAATGACELDAAAAGAVAPGAGWSGGLELEGDAETGDADVALEVLDGALAEAEAEAEGEAEAAAEAETEAEDGFAFVVAARLRVRGGAAGLGLG
jgi:hypothetical protein